MGSKYVKITALQVFVLCCIIFAGVVGGFYTYILGTVASFIMGLASIGITTRIETIQSGNTVMLLFGVTSDTTKEVCGMDEHYVLNVISRLQLVYTVLSFVLAVYFFVVAAGMFVYAGARI